MLRVKGLHARAGGNEVLKGVDISVGPGELVAVMGPNGSGKTTLARAIMGDPRLEVRGTVEFKGEDLSGKPPSDRAKLGIFASFQHPPDVEGVGVGYFLETALGAEGDGVRDMARELGVEELLSKELNVGFSGGERKKLELLQALLADPSLVVLDEIDSGLDIDSVKLVDGIMKRLKSEGKGLLVITHYTRIFSGIRPDRVYVLVDGRVVDKDGPEVLSRLDEFGFEEWR